MYDYPVILRSDTDGFVRLTVPDIPETETYGENEAEAMSRASAAIEAGLMIYIANRWPIPVPSQPSAHQRTVSLCPGTQAQLSQYMANWPPNDRSRNV
jgi:antitoxin HicB